MQHRASRKIFTFIFLGAIGIITFWLPSNSFASIKSGSHCTLSQYNKDVRIKSGSKTLVCIGTPDGYIWALLGSGGSSAHVSNSPARSPFYLRGFNAISNATQDGLVSYNYYAYLNSQNVMTSNNAIRWCAYVAQLIQVRTNAMQGWAPSNVKDWKDGCVSAAMGYAS